MTTGANFKAENGRVQWWKPLIFGDELLIQDHESRAHAKQRAYKPYPEYGNPFIRTLTSEISEIERGMLLVSNMKECALQDARFIDCVVDETSIVVEGNIITFRYELVKADGGSLALQFPSKGETLEPQDPEAPPETVLYNLTTEDGFNLISEDGFNLITEVLT